MKKPIGYIIIFAVSFFLNDSGFCLTRAEQQLKKAYARVLLKADASYEFYKLKQSFDKRFSIHRIKAIGVPFDLVFIFLLDGLILNLSEDVTHEVLRKAQAFIESFNNGYAFPCSKSEAMKIRNDARKTLFEWIAMRLKCYEPLSFNTAYIRQIECKDKHVEQAHSRDFDDVVFLMDKMATLEFD